MRRSSTVNVCWRGKGIKRVSRKHQFHDEGMNPSGKKDLPKTTKEGTKALLKAIGNNVTGKGVKDAKTTKKNKKDR